MIHVDSDCRGPGIFLPRQLQIENEFSRLSASGNDPDGEIISLATIESKDSDLGLKVLFAQ